MPWGPWTVKHPQKLFIKLQAAYVCLLLINEYDKGKIGESQLLFLPIYGKLWDLRRI